MNEKFNIGRFENLTEAADIDPLEKIVVEQAKDIDILKYQLVGSKYEVAVDANTGAVIKDLKVSGVKNDQGKLRYDLVPYNAFREVVKVLTFGASKYDEENWRKVPEWRKRYFAAAMRHILDGWGAGEQNDPESKTHHLSNAITCLMFILEKELTGEE